MLQREHFAILLAYIKLPVVILIRPLFCLFFEWPFYTGFNVIGPAHENLVQKPPINAHVDVSNEVRGQNFGLSPHLHPLFCVDEHQMHS